MNQAELENALTGLPLGWIRYFASLPSTNDAAAQLARDSCPDLTLVLADRQTAGRGRMGKTWHTAPETSLAFSLVLMPPFHVDPAALSRLPGLGALALVEALEQGFGLQAEIKWPNDVLVGPKKIAGILVESQWYGDQLGPVILGTGINVAAGSIPDLSSDPAGLPASSVETETHRPVDRLVLLRMYLQKLIHWCGRLDTTDFLQAWEKHLAWRGEWVRLSPSGSDLEAVEGRLAGLTPEGYLLLQSRDGREVIFQTGEVRLRP